MTTSKTWRRRTVAAVAAGAMGAVGLVAPHGQPPASAATDGSNVALASAGATVSASGTEEGTDWTPDRAVDGITAGNAPDGVQSRWSSNHADDAWIQVELAEPTAVDHVTIYWEAACAAQYRLQVSDDGEDWTDATEVLSPTCGTVDRQELDTTEPVAFVRMQALDRTPIGGTKWGVSLWELEVWDGPEPAPVEREVSLVPQPVELTELDAEPYVLGEDARIIAPGDAAGAGELLATTLRTSTGYDLPVVPEGDGAGDITLAVDPDADLGDLGEEAYRLETGVDGVQIVGASPHGVFNGTQTLRQLFPAFIESTVNVNVDWTAPAVEILDGPRYAHRGIMLDPARSFLTVEEVKDVIDTMAAYKLSTLHFHLADDQSWRIEITNEGKAEDDPIDYTRLTEVSGRTAMTFDGYRNELGRTGYYTQEEFAELVAYAADRHIDVIPEIDIPGHTNAALHAIPELNTAGSSHEGTEDQPTAPPNGTGSVGYSYLDPYDDISYTFVEHVLGQIAALTPGEYIHIGGDESHAMTQRYGHQGYVDFVERAVPIVHGLGKKPIGWSEYAEAALGEGDGIQYWIGGGELLDHIRRAVDDGAKVVMSRGVSSYIDMKYHSKTPIGLTWACSGTCDFPQYYDWDPATVIEGIGDEDILGPEAPMWSETIRGGDQSQFLAFPRAISHAEIGWTPQEQRDVADFTERMADVGHRLLAAGANFYDGDKAAWDYSLAGTDVAAGPGREVTFAVGLLAAPGTKVSEDGTAVAVDEEDDADGVSSSALDGPLTATVDWGDGSEPSDVAFVTGRPRNALQASGTYYLVADHAYPDAGTYEGTVTASDGTVANFTARVAEGTDDPEPPVQPWVPTDDPAIALGADSAPVDGRVRVEISGFEPGEHVLLSLGDTAINSLLPGPDGTLTEWLWIPRGLDNGEHVLTATQREGEDGERSATTTLTVTEGRDPLPNPIPREEYSIAAVSSEETEGEDAPAEYAIDGDATTFWHSRWSSDPPSAPHWITIDLGADYDVEAVEYTPRASGVNGILEEYEVYVSDDAADRGEPVASGSLPGNNDVQLIELPEPAAGRYVTLLYVSARSDSGGSFATAAEIAVGGLPSGEEPDPVVVTPQPVIFTDEPGTAQDSFTVPQVEGVEYLLDGEPVAAGTYPGTGTVTVTARAADGFELADGAPTEWSHTFATGPVTGAPEFHLSDDWRGTTHHFFRYGRVGDEVFVGDWDGDGTDSIAVRRGHTIYVSNAPRGGEADQVFTYGRPEDVLLVGDWDGDGIDTFAVRRGNAYHVKNRLVGGEADVVVHYGRTDDDVLVGDWNGDGRDTFTVRRGSAYHVKNTVSGGPADRVVRYGRADDTVLAGDWDGDGTDTLAVRRGATYHVRNTLTGGDADVRVTFGRAADEVFVGDWDGNGTDTLGVRRTPTP